MGVFFDKVYDAVRLIPKGSVASYGDVARAVGHPHSARYVGYALHVNPHPGDEIPCHRVVFADGRVSDGFAFGGPEVQRAMLMDEGVLFVDEYRVDMERCRFEFLSDGERVQLVAVPKNPLTLGSSEEFW